MRPIPFFDFQTAGGKMIVGKVGSAVLASPSCGQAVKRDPPIN